MTLQNEIMVKKSVIHKEIMGYVNGQLKTVKIQNEVDFRYCH